MPYKPVYLLTCPSAHEPALSRADETLLQAALVARGIPCHILVWSAPLNWARIARHAAAVIVRSTWDYYVDRERFLDVLTTIAARTLLLNPLDVLRWNTHKSYLAHLHAIGLPIVPTVWVKPGMKIDIAPYGWQKAVLKPAIATNAFHTLLFTHEQTALAEKHLAACQTGMLLQPFFEPVLTVGEHSLVCIEGSYSHAFRKKSALGEDTQSEHPITPSASEIRFAEQVLVAIARFLHLSGPDAFLFARVDLVPDLHGQPCLMEVELAEPRLRLADAPDAAERLAAAIDRMKGDSFPSCVAFTKGFPMRTLSSSSSAVFLPLLERQPTALLIVMSEAEYEKPHSPGQGFTNLLKCALKAQQHVSGCLPREPAVTTVPVHEQQDVSDWSAVVEDVHDLLSYTPSVLLVPWLPGMAPAHALDQIQESLAGPVQERTFLRPTVAVKRAAHFGPWNQPVNPQQQLDRYLLWYPGWHDRFTCMETSAGQRVSVVWWRTFQHPPLSRSVCQTAMREAELLLTAAVRPVAGRPSQVYRDGRIYQEYLCTLITRTCTLLDENPQP